MGICIETAAALFFLKKKMGWKWNGEREVWVNVNRPVFLDFGAHQVEPNTTTADLNEGPDPHYPSKDMLIEVDFTALPNTGFSKPAQQHAYK